MALTGIKNVTSSRVGNARGSKNAEVENVGQCGGEQAHPQYRPPGRRVRRVQRPGPVHQQHEGQQHSGRAHLTGCGRQGRDAQTLEPPTEDVGAGLGERAGEAGELRPDARAPPAQRIRPDHRYDSRKAHNDARRFQRRQLLVRREQVGGQHGEQRCGGVRNGDEATGDVVLPPNDQREGDHVVEQPHAEKGGPDRTLCRHALAEDAQQKQERCGGHGDPQPDQGEGGQFTDGHAVEEERNRPSRGPCRWIGSV